MEREGGGGSGRLTEEQDESRIAMNIKCTNGKICARVKKRANEWHRIAANKEVICDYTVWARRACVHSSLERAAFRSLITNKICI